MSTKTARTVRWIGPMQLLTVLLVLLKAGKLIELSWWWVFFPLWFPVGLVLGVLGLAALGALLFTLIVLVLELVKKR